MIHQNTIKMRFEGKDGHAADYTSIATPTPFTCLNWRRWQRIKLYMAAHRADALKRHGLLTLVRLIAAWLHEQI